VTAHAEVLVPHREDDLPVHGGHQEQGINTALLGMLLFIGSEIMFFGGLFAAYFNVRASNTEWPPKGFEIEPSIAAVVTVILVTSSFTMQRAVSRIKVGDRRGMVRALAVTLLLGVVFLMLQVYDYSTLHFGINTGVYGSLFYSLTGFHGAHVFGGVVGISVILLRGASGQFSAKHHVAVEAVSIYWHFVDVVWIALFSTIYFLR
jgi:cytochrome c oxidase subunit 3